MSSVSVPACHTQSQVRWWTCGLHIEPRLLLRAICAVLRTSPLLRVTKPPSWLSRAQGITHLFLDSLLEHPPPIWFHPPPQPCSHERRHTQQSQGTLISLCLEPAVQDIEAPRVPASLFGTLPARASCSCLLARSFFICDLAMSPGPSASPGLPGLPWTQWSLRPAKGQCSPLGMVTAHPCSEPRKTVLSQPWDTGTVTNNHMVLEMLLALLK